MIRTTRDSAGYYQVTDTETHNSVTVLRNPALSGPDKWIARANWERHLVTDPLPTKRDAVREAAFMLANHAIVLAVT